jgi:hypothetical protein
MEHEAMKKRRSDKFGYIAGACIIAFLVLGLTFLSGMLYGEYKITSAYNKVHGIQSL